MKKIICLLFLFSFISISFASICEELKKEVYQNSHQISLLKQKLQCIENPDAYHCEYFNKAYMI